MISFFDWLRVILITALIIPLVYISTRLFGRRYGGGLRGRNFEVVEVLSIDQQNKLVLAKIIDRFYVLSSSPQGLQIIFEVTDPEQINALEEEARRPKKKTGGTR